MTVKEKLIAMFVAAGVFKSQAIEIVELAIPVLNKTAAEINGMKEVDGKMVPVEPYIITWDAPHQEYDDGVYKQWFASSRPVALEWIDKNKPQAWFRQLFV